MKKPAPARRLSGIDAAFVYLERKELPLHIAAVCIFDGPIPFQRFADNIEAKLPLIPRYRQVLEKPPYDMGLPWWIDAPGFDIRNHILPATVPRPGGQRELEELAGRILTPVMDRTRPLWDIHVVDGLKDGRGALVVRVHHSLADGISGAALMRVMLDADPDAPPPPKARYRPRRVRAGERPLSDSLGEILKNTVDGIVAAEAGLLGFVNSVIGGRLQQDLDGVAPLLPEFAASIERLPFNRPCTGARRFHWASFPLEDVQAIRRAGEGTVNDVVLAALTCALARYSRMHRQTIAKRFVRVVCPVSLRGGEGGESLGNRISFLPVALPLDVRGPMRRLQAVAARTRIMKRAHAGDLVALLGAFIIAAPPPLQSLFWSVLPEIMLPVPLLNLICTNIPGSPVPLYAAGRRMLAAYPHVPTGYDLGVGVAVQTYDGNLFLGLTSDADAAPDAGRLRDYIVDSLEELARAAGVRRAPARPKRAAARRPARKAGVVVMGSQAAGQEHR